MLSMWAYTASMPKLWESTVEAHRTSVRDSITQTAWQLARSGGVRALSMSRIAAEVGISRATLYKYFDDIDAVLLAGHEQQVMHHLDQLRAAVASEADPTQALRALLVTYARIVQHRGQHQLAELAAAVHQPSSHQGQSALLELVAGAVAATTPDLADETSPADLAEFCIQSLAAAASEGVDVEALVSFCLRGVGITMH